MTEVWTIYGGDMWRQVFNGVVTVIGSDTYDTLKRIAGLFGVLGVIASFIKSRNPMVFANWLAIFLSSRRCCSFQSAAYRYSMSQIRRQFIRSITCRPVWPSSPV